MMLLCLLPAGLGAHPIPDIPVRTAFPGDGGCIIQVEVDPRCFEADPNKAPYLLQEQWSKLTDAGRDALKQKARTFVQDMVEFFFVPMGRIAPEFVFEFTTNENVPLASAGDPVVLTGTWRTPVPAGMEGYRIRAREGCQLAVLFLNTLHGRPVERMAVLFPGETSYLLDLEGKNATAASAPPPITADPEAGAAGWWLTWGRPMLLFSGALGLLLLARRAGWV